MLCVAVMASPGLLFLLLSSSLLLSSLSAPSSSDQQENYALQKRTDVKDVALTVLQYVERIGTATAPFLGLIPIHGTLISAIVNLASVFLSLPGMHPTDQTQALIKEFENLNMKIDKYHIQQTWATWASEYQTHENKINGKWKDFQELFKYTNSEELKKHIELFKKTYKTFEPEPKLLHGILTAKGDTFMTNFGKLLTDHVRCHEKEIRKFTVFINQLIFKGNVMNHFYYTLMKVNKVDELAEIAYVSAFVMVEIQNYCLSHLANYIELDVKERIDEKINRNDLAKNIRVFLETTYDRYDWMVVAFPTKNFQHSFFRIGKKHSFSGFTQVPKGDVTVAVAWQAKGYHTEASKVIEAIKKCVSDSVNCKDVPKTLEACKGIKDGTIIHAYTSEGHDITSATDAKGYKADENDNISVYEYDDADNRPYTIPYYYKGKCKKNLVNPMHGRFIVMIKSDEEINNINPCNKKKCGVENKRGSCEVLENTLIAVCKCVKPYYGRECEENLVDYKKAMKVNLPAK